MRVFVALLLLGLTPAHAAESENVEVARAHFNTAKVYFANGEFEKALAEFQAAARYSPRPELLYNIGRCFEQMGDAAQALANYRRYLKAVPNAGDRGEVEQAIEQLGRRVGQLQIRSTVPEV